MKKLFNIMRRVLHFYNDKQIPLASAALCYYMMMTFFPLIICLYTLLGKSYETASQALAVLETFATGETMKSIRSFLEYVSENHSTAMFYAGATVLLTSASAGLRSVHITIGRMQGGQRFRGIQEIAISVVLAVAFLMAIWFAILVMFTGRDLITFLNEKLPFVDISGSWQSIKYLLLAAIFFLILWGIYLLSKNRGAGYSTWPGALLGTAGMVLMSRVFSGFIAASARYSLVYGSMASVILLMLWLYFSCQIIYVGAALNIALRDRRISKGKGI